MSSESSITLKGGPFDGWRVSRPDAGSVLLSGRGVAEGMVARYRRTRDRAVYRFDGYDRVVLSIPAPAGEPA